MKQYKVLLYSSEEGFVFALMNYINRDPQMPILAIAFSKQNELKTYLQEHRPDLLVIEPDGLRSQSCREGAVELSVTGGTVPVLWILDAETGKEPEGGLNWPLDPVYVIPKYSPASVYCRRMLQILSESNPYMNMEHSCTCVGVYSPVGRCGKTTLSRALCRYYSADRSERGNGCLYLGWEEFAEHIDENRRMEELLFYIKERTENISLRIKSLATEECGYDCIPCAVSYQELREIRREDISWLFDQIRSDGLYRWLVVDIGTGSLSDLELLTEFDVLYLPCLREAHSRQKVAGFRQSMQDRKCWESLEEHCYPVFMNEAGISSEEIRSLEESRRDGSQRTMAKEEHTLGDRTALQ